MHISFPLRIGSLLLALIVVIPSIHAQENNNTPVTRSADTCRAEVNNLLAKEQRIYRTVLFGRTKAEDAPISEVRFDKIGGAWYKKSKSKWQFVGDTQDAFQLINGEKLKKISDGKMDSIAELDSIPIEDGGIDLRPPALPRKSIFDRKRTLTSDLIPYLTQNIRALGCRIDMVCYLIESSTEVKGSEKRPQEVLIDVKGCLNTKWNSIPEYHFTEEVDIGNKADVIQYCDKVAAAMMEREIEVLKMLVEYDAAYRSLLQFAGVFDEFLLEFRWTLTGSIRQAAATIGWLHRIPCFISSCDEYPPGLDPHEIYTPHE